MPRCVRSADGGPRAGARSWRTPALLVALALTVSACSGAGGGGGTSTAPTHRATGTPIAVGLINMEDAPLGSFPELRQGAEAAARYVNDELDGIGGRPLQLVPCTTNGTPESSQGCANQVLSRHPVAVIGGVDVGAGAALPALEKAGVAYVSGSPTSAAALTSNGSYMLSGGTAAEILGEVAYATDTLHARRVVAVYTDVPGLVADAAGLLGIILKKKGVEDFRTVPVPANAPDLTPAIASAQSAHPDTVLMAFPAQACARSMQAAASTGLNAHLFYPSICAEQRVIAAAGSGVEGSYFAAGYVPYVDTADPQVATYRRQLTAYDRSLQPSLLSQTGFSVVMDLRALLAALPADRRSDPAALAAALRATRNQPSFMGHPYTCDGKQVPALTSVCSMSVRILRLEGGSLHPVGDWVDGTPLVRLVSG